MDRVGRTTTVSELILEADVAKQFLSGLVELARAPGTGFRPRLLSAQTSTFSQKKAKLPHRIIGFMEQQQPPESNSGEAALERWETSLMKRLFEWSPSKHAFRLSALAELMHPDDAYDLYHYTTLDGLKGITESHSIWATAINYLNDASEIRYGCSVLDEVLTGWEKANETNNSRAACVLELLRDAFNARDAKTGEMEFYVACFCEEGNLLSQWRAYGQAGGYSIGFALRGRGLQRVGPPRLVDIKPEKKGYETRLVRVIYEPTEQRERLHAVLRFALPILDDPELLRTIPEGDKEASRGYLVLATVIIEGFLLQEIVRFKNKAFAEEHEWRIVVRATRDIRVNAPVVERGIQLRPSRGLMVPYVRLVPTSGRLPITSIRFGPSLEKSRAENSLKTLCALHGYEGAKIDGSNIPVVL